MAKLYLDHDVSLRLAPLLGAVGHEVTTARDAGLERATDAKQLLTAAQQGRVLLTHNRKDFVLLDDAWRNWPATWGVAAPSHHGILALDHGDEAELSAAVHAFLTATPAPRLTNAVYWWRSHRGWHRQLSDRRWVPNP